MALLVGAPEEGDKKTSMDRVEGAVGAADDVHTIHVVNAVAVAHDLEKMAAVAEEAGPAAGLVASADHKVTTEAWATRFCRLGFLVAGAVVCHKPVEHDPAQRVVSSSSCSVDYRLDDEAVHGEAAVDAVDKTLLAQVVPRSLWLAKAPLHALEAALSAQAAWGHSLDIRIRRAHNSCSAALLHRTSSFGPCKYGIRSSCGC